MRQDYDIPGRIKAAMKKKGITQADISRQLGISQAAVSSRILKTVSIPRLLQLLDILEITPAEFFADADDGPQTEAVTICPHCKKPLYLKLTTITEKK